VQIGKQPSGLAINRAGDLALVANRNDKSISLLSIKPRIDVHAPTAQAHRRARLTR
jgi:hypothetical protein